MRQGLAACQATGSELLAAVFSRSARRAPSEEGGAAQRQGLTLLAEALAIVQRTGERRWEAELYRLQGELLLRTR